jgi:hypothetical protein
MPLWGGGHILLEGVTKDEVTLVAMGYRYNQKMILFFVFTKSSGSSKPRDPYQMKQTDSFGNICTQYVNWPQVISNFLLVRTPSILLIINYVETL